MRRAGSHLRSESVRTATLIAGIAAAATAFTVLYMNAAAPTVQIRGTLPASSPRRAYDILVRVPSRVTERPSAASAVRPADLAELSGGITLAQYEAIRRLPGVQVAAPMTMVGYVPLTVVIPVTVPSRAIANVPEIFTVSVRQQTDGGLSTVTQRNAGSTYVTRQPLPAGTGSDLPLVCAGPPIGPPVMSGSPASQATCWSTTTGPDQQTWAGPQPSALSVPLDWTFLLPLVAVDPAAEARLLHLDRAVVQGSYLPSTAVSGPPRVPVIMASSIDDDARDSLTLSRLLAAAAPGVASVRLGPLLATSAGQTVGAFTVTAAQAYAALVGYLRGSAVARVPAYWTPSPARYVAAADGALMPLPVPSGAGFRTLTAHVARSVTRTAGRRGGPAGVALAAVGVFDPARIASSLATPSPYRGERLSAADARSRQLLGGATLGPDGNPAGYPSPGATLVMPLRDIGAFTGAAAYTGTDADAPIGSVRVRVAGATGDDALSRERVRVVAAEIVRATGLRVDVTLAASAVLRTVDLPASPDGRPALSLREAWDQSDTSTAVSSGVDPCSVALPTAVLLIGSAFAASGVMATIHARRREIATLRALGWRRRQVTWRLGRDFALIAAAAGVLAVLAAYALEALLHRSQAGGWPLLSIPAALAMTLCAAWWQLRRATTERQPQLVASLRRSRGWRRPPDVLGHAARTILSAHAPGRDVLGALVITVACAALGLELAVRWVFGGSIVGSWPGGVVSWQDDPADVAAVITLLAQATVTIADLGWRNSGERTAELRTLRAIGWSSRGVARLAAREAALLGLIGGVVASTLDLAGIAAVVHAVPAGLMLVSAVVIAAGVAISVLAAGLSAAAQRAITPPA